jgi:hypothetical protein
MTRFGVAACICAALFWFDPIHPALAEDRADAPVPSLGAATAAHMQVPAQMAIPAASAPVLPPGTTRLAPAASPRPVVRQTWPMPRLAWDDHPQGARWTVAVMAALRSHGAPLLDVVPRDIAAWCPGYPQADAGQRAAFWAGLVSTLAWHESTHRPTAVGGEGRWFGLVQIAPGTARWRNCAVGTGEALLDGPANLRCGIRIMAATVPRDGVVAQGMRGVAADWGPFHSERKREDMRRWVRAQPYCQSPLRAALRPVMRPVMRPVSGSGTGSQGPDPAVRLSAAARDVGAAMMTPIPRPAGPLRTVASAMVP